MTKLSKVNDISQESKDVALWKKIEDPIIKAKMQAAEDSIPKDEFEFTGQRGTVTIKEITVKRGKLGDVIGWEF